MNLQETEKLPPPPGLIAAFTAGFEAIANHIAVILIPIAVDVFLWMGTHLRIETISMPLIKTWVEMATESGLSAQVIQVVQDGWETILARMNLVTFLRTFPIGVPSLLAVLSPTETPLGNPPATEIDSFLMLAAWLLVLTLTGWMLGSFYYYWVAHIALRRDNRTFSLGNVVYTLANGLVLNATWLAVLFVAGIPVLLFLSVMMVLSAVVAQFFYFLIGLLIMWLMLPVFFSPHGIFAYRQNAFASIFQSMRMLRFTIPGTSTFVLLMLVISQGLAFLWRIPPQNSWMLLVGVAAHAFVSTAVLAASFIYYRDMNAWIQVILERLKPQTTSARA